MKLTETINLFVEPKPYKKNKEDHVFYKLTTTISTKQKDETYKKMSLDIIANDKKFPEAVLAKLDPKFMYTANVLNGWLIVDDYVNKEGKTIKKLCLYIEDMKLTGRSPIDQEKREKARQGAKAGADGENPDLPF